jgi:hypothetical protein
MNLINRVGHAWTKVRKAWKLEKTYIGPARSTRPWTRRDNQARGRSSDLWESDGGLNHRIKHLQVAMLPADPWDHQCHLVDGLLKGPRILPMYPFVLALLAAQGLGGFDVAWILAFFDQLLRTTYLPHFRVSIQKRTLIGMKGACSIYIPSAPWSDYGRCFLKCVFPCFHDSPCWQSFWHQTPYLPRPTCPPTSPIRPLFQSTIEESPKKSKHVIWKNR